MPTRPQRSCRVPNCPNLIRDGSYCADHAREHSPTRTQTPERKADKAFYDSARWKRFRDSFLARNPLCKNYDECHQLAEHVDHIVPRKQYSGNPVDATNCQALCASCHSRKTRRGE